MRDTYSHLAVRRGHVGFVVYSNVMGWLRAVIPAFGASIVMAVYLLAYFAPSWSHISPRVLLVMVLSSLARGIVDRPGAAAHGGVAPQADYADGVRRGLKRRNRSRHEAIIVLF